MAHVKAPLADAPTAKTSPAAAAQNRRGLRGYVLGALLAAGVIGMALSNVLLGAFQVSFADFIKILQGETIPGATFIIMEDRLPRTLTGIAVGVALGLAGWYMQAILRNPLASPDILGITVGASAGAVISIIVVGGSYLLTSLFSLAGALLVAALMLGISYRGGIHGNTLILTGIGLSSGMYAFVNFFLSRTSFMQAADAVRWLNGSLNSTDWGRFQATAVCVVVVAVACFILTPRLRILELGDELAAGLGLRVNFTKFAMLLGAVLLAAFSAAAVGPLSFVAFMAGACATSLGNWAGWGTGRKMAGVAASIGVLIVLASDFAGRTALGNVSVPAGVITGAIGAPMLLWLLVGTKRNER